MAGVASTRASFCWRLRVRKAALVLLSAATLVAGFWFDVAPAQAQIMTFPQRPQRVKPKPIPRATGRKGADAAAGDRGAVRLHQQARLGGRQRADLSSAARRSRPTRLTYDETTKRLRAEGNVRLTEPDGRITYSDVMDLSDDFRDGFVNSLRLDTADADPHGGGARRPLRRHTSPSSTAASTPPANPARTIPRSRRPGRSRRRA